MIKAEHIVKSYAGGAPVLRDVSLEIANRSMTVVSGASGSGKSTLLSVLSGLERPDEGKIICNGEELTAMTDKQLTDFRRRTVGFIFQQYFLLPHLTVENNVKMGANLAGNGNYADILEAVGLSGKRRRYPGELSGGEQQRVSIARALAKNPRVLFLDEPTGALDEETGRSVLDYVLRLQKEIGFTAIMVTHNLNIAETADTVVKINSGKIAEITRNPFPRTAYEIGW